MKGPMDEVYSRNLKRRYRVSVSTDVAIIARARKWPGWCGGVANAFLALVGPSGGLLPIRPPVPSQQELQGHSPPFGLRLKPDSRAFAQD
jgi:hypothetical protein